jgi:hypothetical protein
VSTGWVRPGRIVLIVVASLLALVGFGLFAGGAALGLFAATQRDDAGYFTTATQRYETATSAVTSQALDLVAESGPRWFADRDWASVRLRVDGIAADEVFIGIGSVADVERYLLDVPHDAVTHLSFGPFRVEYERRNPEGAATPQTPADADIWVASATGSAPQTMTWDLEPGRWMVVVMNADASPGVSVALDAGLRADVVVPIAVALLVGGLVLIALSVPLLVVGASSAAGDAGAQPLPPPTVAGPVPAAGLPDSRVEPVRVTARLDSELRRWMWLVKWFLAIPHLIVLFFLWVAFAVLTIVAFFAILFTGRYPRGIFEFNVGVLRWHWRVAFYAFSVLGTDRYPPFSLHAEDYPADLDVAYPERLSRGLVLVKWWLLAIPHFVIVGIFVGSWSYGVADAGRTVVSGPNLVGFLAVVAGVILLFTGRYPSSIFDLLMGLHRWILRVVVYVTLMTDRYPPFRLDQGSNEPAADSPPAGFPPPPA